MKSKTLFTLIALFFGVMSLSFAQNSNYLSLLPESLMDEFIGEASGERAMNHIIEMGAYNHNRPTEEYTGNFFETDYIISKLNEYNLSGVVVNRYPGGEYWDGIRGELWEVSPGRTKLADYDDLTAMLAQGSVSGDVTAKLVWVDGGSAADLDKYNIEGKIVVTSGSPRSVHNRAVERGALGLISFNSPRPLKVNNAIPITGISGRGSSANNATFGFFLPPREGHLLRDRLLRGEEITVHAVVESQSVNYQLEVPSCVIEGTDDNASEIILSAHLFEGYVKQGANDNISGSAAILEVARMLQSMIDEGRIERPKRSIRFIWVPEFSGTIPWVAANMDIMNKTLCNINLDMVGLNLSDSQSFLCMQRTTYGNPHYINDVMENYYDYVGITNREGLAISGRGGFTKRIVAPSGTDDPFYYSVDDHYGASDHEVFNDPAVSVPGIMMITWPDLYYHTSQDRADKCDPTQLKRVAVIAAAAVYTIASSDKQMGIKIANEVVGNGSARIGKQLVRATDLLSGSDRDNFASNYIQGRRYIEAAVINEKATLLTIIELSNLMEDYITDQSATINSIGKANLASFDSYMKAEAQRLGVKSVEYKLTSKEQKASVIVVNKTPKVVETGYGLSRSISNEIETLKDKYPVRGRIDINEILRLSNGINSVLDIKILLDGQLKKGVTDLESVINSISILKELGYLN